MKMLSHANSIRWSLRTLAVRFACLNYLQVNSR